MNLTSPLYSLAAVNTQYGPVIVASSAPPTFSKRCNWPWPWSSTKLFTVIVSFSGSVVEEIKSCSLMINWSSSSMVPKSISDATGWSLTSVTTRLISALSVKKSSAPLVVPSSMMSYLNFTSPLKSLAAMNIQYGPVIAASSAPPAFSKRVSWPCPWVRVTPVTVRLWFSRSELAAIKSLSTITIWPSSIIEPKSTSVATGASFTSVTLMVNVVWLVWAVFGSPASIRPLLPPSSTVAVTVATPFWFR